MRILALDPAEYRVGWALGEAGAKPEIGVLKLRDKDERTEDAIARFAKWLHELLTTKEVRLLVVEHFLPAGALKGHSNADSREGQVGLGYASRAVAAIADVHFRSPAPATIRVHFCGKASGGDRSSTKAMVIKQAQLLGYIPRDCFEDNMADAAAIFDFASSYFGRKAAAFSLR